MAKRPTKAQREAAAAAAETAAAETAGATSDPAADESVQDPSHSGEPVQTDAPHSEPREGGPDPEPTTPPESLGDDLVEGEAVGDDPHGAKAFARMNRHY